MYMEYISIGTDKLLEEYFYQVVNSDRQVKPAGGLWNTIFFAPTFSSQAHRKDNVRVEHLSIR